jgi:hypothetical protein
MVSSTRYSAYFLIVTGFAFAVSSLMDARRGRWHLVPFTLAMAVIFIGAGAAILWVLARKSRQRPDSSTSQVPEQYLHVQDAANDR